MNFYGLAGKRRRYYPTSWTQRTSNFGTEGVFGCAHNGTHWCIGGAAGDFATATNPTGTWVIRATGAGDTINDVDWDGTYWCLSSSDGYVYTATDPTSTPWTQNSSPYHASFYIHPLAYGNGNWVLSTLDSPATTIYLYTASNPTGTWTSRSHPFGTNIIQDFFYDSGNSIWIAVGDSGKLATASDPTSTWTLRTSSFSTTNIWGVACGGGICVAVGDSGKLATSPDGITWVQQTSSFDTTNIREVGYGNNIFVAVGESGKLATSPNGMTWTQQTSSFSSDHIYKVEAGTNYWLAIGETGKIATSPTS